MTEKTGLTGDGKAGALEVLGEHSLHDYLDGALLQKGADIVNLKNYLGECARESFMNIRDIVSELHGLYYLFHKAREGTRVFVVNMAADEFRLWMDAQNLTAGGRAPFQAITDPARSARAANVRRPGLLYLSKLAFVGLNPVAELKSWAQLELSRHNHSYIIPPVLLPSDLLLAQGTDWRQPAWALDAALRPQARFPWLIVGPSNYLNRADDQEFPTYVPAGYLLLARFLGMENAEMQPNDHSPEPSLGRIRRVSGVGPGIERDLDNALTQPLAISRGGPVHQFLADYDLYAILSLYADMRKAGVVARQILDDFWDNQVTMHWGRLDAVAAGGVHLKECFFANDPRRSRFATNVAGAAPGTGVPVLDRAGEVTASDTAWFTRALHDIEAGI
jgi:hypothetical protein